MTKLARLALNDEGFAFDPVTGDSFVLNETALFVVKELQAGTAEADVVAALVRTYDVVEADAERDVRDVLERLASFGLAGEMK